MRLVLLCSGGVGRLVRLSNRTTRSPTNHVAKVPIIFHNSCVNQRNTTMTKIRRFEAPAAELYSGVSILHKFSKNSLATSSSSCSTANTFQA